MSTSALVADASRKVSVVEALSANEGHRLRGVLDAVAGAATDAVFDTSVLTPFTVTCTDCASRFAIGDGAEVETRACRF
jgi:hypothetical protein